MSGRLYCVNTGFDVRMSGMRASYRAVLREHAYFGALLGGAGDFFLTTETIPDEYFAYLESAGIPPALPFKNPIPGLAGVAWGMDAEARAALEACGATVEFPDESIVRRANARTFSNMIAMKNDWPCGTELRTPEDLSAYCARAKGTQVIRPVHGSSGAGAVFIEEPYDVPRRIPDGLSAGEVFVIEPWRARTEDYSAGGVLSRHGELREVTFRRLFNSPRGNFAGLELVNSPRGLKEARALETLSATLDTCARELHAIGYFGPFSIDAYGYIESGEERFNPLSEINARLTMADIAKSVSAKTGNDSLKIVISGKTEGVDTYADIALQYGPDTRILLSPFTVSGLRMKKWLWAVRDPE